MRNVERAAEVLFPVIHPQAAQALANGWDAEWDQTHVRAAEALADADLLKDFPSDVAGKNQENASPATPEASGRGSGAGRDSSVEWLGLQPSSPGANIERAIKVLSTCTCPKGANQYGAWRVIEESCPLCGSPRAKAQTLADTGVIPRDDAEITVEYGVRYAEWIDTGGFESLDSALIDAASTSGTAVQRTVTTHRSEWTEAEE